MTVTRRTVLTSLAAAAGVAALPGTASAAAGSRTVWDDFSGGFSSGPDGKWSFLDFGPDFSHDGTVTTSAAGLRVESSGTNPATGRPAFRRTVGPADPSGLPGTLDHVKWLVYANTTAASGVLGFDTTAGEEIGFETWMSGQAYGVRAQPFGAAVPDPDDDLRLAAVGLPVQDLESGVAFDFMMTNKAVYVFYERLPHNRPVLGDYAAFLYTVPVAGRTAGQSHHFKITYDRTSGTACWFLDGCEVFRVDKVGHRLASRRHLMLDHGGTDQLVTPRQLAAGIGVFTILDGALPGRSGSGLVRLTPATGHYFNPLTGPPTAQTFLDDQSLASNRLFGQGAGLRVRRFVVTRRGTAG